MAKVDVTAERLRELLDYDPQTGLFTRRSRRGGIANAGSVVGLKANCSMGYVQISIDNRLYLGHRLAWLHVHGTWPTKNIDHINGNRLDNRLENLRDVSQSVNVQNMRRPRSDNKTGVLGVSVGRRGKYKAQIVVDGRNTCIGDFATIEEAKSAYLEAKRKVHEGCTI